MEGDTDRPKVEFEESSWQADVKSRQVATRGMGSWLMRHSGGILKTEEQAQYVLGLIAVIAIAISAHFFTSIGDEVYVPPGALENPEYGLPIRD